VKLQLTVQNSDLGPLFKKILVRDLETGEEKDISSLVSKVQVVMPAGELPYAEVTIIEPLLEAEVDIIHFIGYDPRNK
jgi:hypothetical protein